MKRAAAAVARRLRYIPPVVYSAGGIAVLVALALAWAIYSGPPRHLSIASGTPGRAGWALGTRYAAVLAREHVTLRQQASGGALESLQRLSDPHSGIDLALVQGGLTDPEHSPGLVSLGSLDYLPLWVFHRLGPGIGGQLQALRGHRITVGAASTGLHRTAERVLALAGVDAGTATLLPLSGPAALAALERGEADAGVFMGAPDDELVQTLFHHPALQLLRIDEADAIHARLPFLHVLTLPRGTVDVARRIPDTDLPILASTLTLAARDTLHPALAYLVLEALTETHHGPGLLHPAGTFPSERDVDLPLSPVAERFYRSGTPFLQRHLPFWLASAVDRMLWALIPLAAVLVPLMRLLPGLYAWRVRARIFRWYARLLQLEARMSDPKRPLPRAEALAQLAAIEDGVAGLRTPLSFSHERYILREHIELVRRTYGMHASGPEG